jgi:GPH family glycoside/pentoside/hexuronide:cation symporter
MSPEMETQKVPLNQPKSEIRKNSPILYGLGSFGIESTYKVFVGFYMFYYIDVLGLAIALAAIINVIYAIWDAVNDPLVGYLSDNTRTRWGRRRPWLIAGLPFYLVFLVFIYAVPEFFRDAERLFWYALVMIFLFETASTVLSTNYKALFPEIFQGLRIRARASAYNNGFGMAGELVGFSLTPIVYSQFGFVGMAVLFSAIMGIPLFLSIGNISEKPEIQESPPVDLKGAFRDVLQDRLFWQFTFVLTFILFTTGIYTLATPFWTKYTINASPQTPALIFGIVFIVAIASVSIWSRLIRNWGLKKSWLWAIGLMGSSAVVIGMATNLLIGVIGAALAGAGLGGAKVCNEIILAKLVDQSLIRTGHHREGIYYSLSRFVGRLSKILESLALVLLGVLFGYVSGENPGPHPENAFRFLISVFPFIFLIIAWILARRMPLDEMQ